MLYLCAHRIFPRTAYFHMCTVVLLSNIITKHVQLSCIDGFYIFSDISVKDKEFYSLLHQEGELSLWCQNVSKALQMGYFGDLYSEWVNSQNKLENSWMLMDFIYLVIFQWKMRSFTVWKVNCHYGAKTSPNVPKSSPNGHAIWRGHTCTKTSL